VQIAFFVLVAIFIVVGWFVLKRRARKSAETRRRRSVLAGAALLFAFLGLAGWFVGVVSAVLAHGHAPEAGRWGLRAGVEPVAVVSALALVLGAIAVVRCVSKKLRGKRAAVFALLIAFGALFLTFAVLRAP
jgi:hypothetical protein